MSPIMTALAAGTPSFRRRRQSRFRFAVFTLLAACKVCGKLHLASVSEPNAVDLSSLLFTFTMVVMRDGNGPPGTGLNLVTSTHALQLSTSTRSQWICLPGSAAWPQHLLR